MARTHVNGRLETEFTSQFDRDTISRFVNQAFDELSDHATVDSWVPVLAERFARQQLTALAKIEGHDDTLPVVLFLDDHDAGRSQLARALFARHAGDRAHSWSGGVEPALEIHPQVAVALAPFEIDLAHEFPKPLTDEVIQGADVVVVLGKIPFPLPEGKRVVAWDLPPLEDLDDDSAESLGVRIDALSEELAADLFP